MRQSCSCHNDTIFIRREVNLLTLSISNLVDVSPEQRRKVSCKYVEGCEKCINNLHAKQISSTAAVLSSILDSVIIAVVISSRKDDLQES